MRWQRLATFVFALLALTTTVASAQNRYRPARPALSPYLDYFRSDTGVLDPYNTFVSPNRTLRDQLSNQETGISRLQGQVQQVEGQFSDYVRGARAAPTGARGRFSDYSHYYNFRRRR